MVDGGVYDVELVKELVRTDDSCLGDWRVEERW